MTIWLLTVGEPLPGEMGRLLRAGQLARKLAARGHAVTWWTSRFDHFTKQHRTAQDGTSAEGDGYKLRLLGSRGYQRNRSIARLIDHAQIARAFRHEALLEPGPDLILASFPTVDCAAAAVAVGREVGAATMLDVRDLWPDVLVEGAPAWLRPVADAAATPMRRRARSAFRGATAICAVTDSYLTWALQLAGRARSPLDCVFPLAYESYAEDQEAPGWDVALRREMGLPSDGRPIVCFAGTIGHQFDLSTVLTAVSRFDTGAESPLWVFCGDGELLNRYRATRSDRSVKWLGRLDARRLRAVMKASSVGLAPYRQSENFTSNVPNKILEYLGNGLPVVSCLEGETARLLSRHHCGVQYAPGDPSSLAAAIETAMRPQAREDMARNAANIYASYTSVGVYSSMIEHLQFVIDESRAVSPRLSANAT